MYELSHDISSINESFPDDFEFGVSTRGVEIESNSCQNNIWNLDINNPLWSPPGTSADAQVKGCTHWRLHSLSLKFKIILSWPPFHRCCTIRFENHWRYGSRYISLFNNMVEIISNWWRWRTTRCRIWVIYWKIAGRFNGCKYQSRSDNF